jgi:hypothetical protein
MESDVPTAYELFFSGRRFEPRERTELEKLFFSNVRLRNGTFKTTNHRRLDDLNELVNRHLPGARPLRIMDVAVSSGVSTAEWVESLDRLQTRYEMVAGDISVRALLISAGFGLRLLTDRSAFPLQYDLRGYAVRADAGKRQRLRHAAPLLWLSVARLLARRSLRRIDSAQSPVHPARAFGLKVRQVRLLSEKLQSLDNVEVVEDDILVDSHFQNSLHIVRAANILNLVYFSKPTLAKMVTNLRARLKHGGMLVVCRTLDSGVNHGTIFKLADGGQFEVIARLNDGSEIESIVLAAHTSAG